MKKALMTATLLMMASLAQAGTVAVVNGDDVDSSVIENYVTLLKTIPELSKASAEELDKMAFMKMVEDTLMVKEASKRGLDKSSDYTKAMKEVEDNVKKQGLDKAAHYDLKLEMTKKELLKNLLMVDILKNTKVSDADLKEMIKAHNDAYKGSKIYTFQRIGIQKADNVKKAYDELKKKTEFSKVKEKYGVMGDRKDQVFVLNSKDLQVDPTNAKLGKELESIKVGQYNDKAFAMDNFKFIFKVDKVDDFKPATLEADKKAFEDQLKFIEAQKTLASYLTDAKIEVKDDKYKFFPAMMKEMKAPAPKGK